MESTWNFSPQSSMSTHYNTISSDKKISETFTDLLPHVDGLEALRYCINPDRLRENVIIENKCKQPTLDFHPVSINDVPLMMEFFKSGMPRSCDYSIGGIMMWVDFFNYEIAIVENTLFLKGFDHLTDTVIYYSPIGEMNVDDAWEMIVADHQHNGGRAIFISDLETSLESYEKEIVGLDGYQDAWKEYLYEIEKFQHFGGKKMEKKRNHLHYFINHYENVNVEPISSENCNELIRFVKEFEKNHEESALLNYESSQTIMALKKYSSFPFDGLLLRHEGRIIGFTFGEKTGDVFHVHVEKGNIEYQGVYQALSSDLANMVAEKYPDVRYLNREEDMGIESLRKSKESYHPVRIVNKRIRSVD